MKAIQLESEVDVGDEALVVESSSPAVQVVAPRNGRSTGKRKHSGSAMQEEREARERAKDAAKKTKQFRNL